eukprot:12746-Eustigmatos_ZCMA.PRE.1
MLTSSEAKLRRINVCAFWGAQCPLSYVEVIATLSLTAFPLHTPAYDIADRYVGAVIFILRTQQYVTV